jgi:uncharacterized protein YndB with AHSA1/START domain
VDVDRTAPAIASSEIEVAAPPEVVWDVLADFESWPEWNPDVGEVTIDGPVAQGTEFRWKTGALPIRSTLSEVERPNVIGWTGKAPGIRAVHVWRFEPRGAGTRVVTEESWAGPLPRLLRGPMRSALEKALDSGLPRLRAEAERRASG